MIKREASITPAITAYIKIKSLTGLFEVKQTRLLRFNLNNFEPQQLESLMAAERSGLVWKISDADQRLKPCDIISVGPRPSTIVIKIQRAVFFIEARMIYNMIQGGVKSLSGSECSLIAYAQFQM